jgi:hypothetical protein
MNKEKYILDLYGAITSELSKTVISFGDDLAGWGEIKAPNVCSGLTPLIKPFGNGFVLMLDTYDDTWFKAKFNLRTGYLRVEHIDWWVNPRAVEPIEVLEGALIGIHRLINIMKDLYNASQTRTAEPSCPVA